MPVFNTLCPSTSSITTACLNAAHSTTDPGLPLGPGDTEIYKLASGSHDQFHIVGFAGFFVTCATKNSSSTACPGKNLALSIGALPAANKGTIEGYFLSGYTFQSTSGTGGVNVGINMVSLNQ
jgi:hypothetical protein